MSVNDAPNQTASDAYHAGILYAAQIAFDQTTDHPEIGTWNDACEHIAKLLREAPGRLCLLGTPGA